MIILHFSHTDNDNSYFLFDSRGQLEEYLEENYDEVVFYNEDRIVFMTFDEMRLYAEIIQPIEIIKTEKP